MEMAHRQACSLQWPGMELGLMGHSWAVRSCDKRGSSCTYDQGRHVVVCVVVVVWDDRLGATYWFEPTIGNLGTLQFICSRRARRARLAPALPAYRTVAKGWEILSPPG